MVESLELYEGAMPAQYTDRTAGALDVHTRDGGRNALSFRGEASMSNAGFTAEGPIDRAKRASWLVSARKSYLQYLIDRIGVDTSLVFGLQDVQARLTYDLTRRNFLSFDILESYTNLDRSARRTTLGVNSLMLAGYDFTVAKIGWRYTPNEKFILHSRAAWMREKFDNQNPQKLLLGEGFYGEWVGSQSATWIESARSTLDFGWSARAIRDQGYADQYQSNLTARLLENYRGNSTRGGVYFVESFSAWSGLLHLAAGGRFDRDSLDRHPVWLPQASLSLSPAKSTRFQLAWGEYAQYPEVAQLTSNLGNRGLLPARTIQFTASVEQRLDERTRLRAEFYNRTDRDLLFQPLYDPRIVITNGISRVFVPPLNALYYNSLRGYSRGFEIFLQRSSANRLTGWISYAYGHAQMREGIDHIAFPSEWDQRHSVNVYAGYRLRPSVNLSVRSVFGTGFPIPGFLQKVGSNYYLATQRDGTRLDNYLRTDFRVNKNWTKVKWKTTLYGELINLTNQSNYRFDSFNGYNSATRQAFISLDKLFPILPSVGIVVER
jgi:hypothetical protein